MPCAVFKLFRVCQALNRETNGSPQLLVYFLSYEREQEVHKYVSTRNISELAT